MKTPLVVGLVFCVGTGIGVSWKLGLLPLDLTSSHVPADDEDNIASDETDDSFAGTRVASPAEWAVEQDEPPVQEGVNQKLSEVEEPRLLEEPEEEIAVPIIRSGRQKATAKPQATGKPFQRSVPEHVRPARFQAETEESPALVEPKPDNRFAEIDEKLAAGEILAAHKLQSKMYWNKKGRDDELQERLDDTAKKIFFSPQPHFIEPYVVQPGDQLRKIAGKYQLSWEYLAALNKTDPRRIREGQKLKVLKGPFAAIVNLKEFALTIHLQGYYVRRYPVGIGKDGSSPVGKFPVLGKIENPQYTDPDGKVIEGDDPKNPLGERWIDLGDSYGIHGTIDPDSIGQAASRGCIRLRDADIIEVYNLLVTGSTVEIRE